MSSGIVRVSRDRVAAVERGDEQVALESLRCHTSILMTEPAVGAPTTGCN